MRPLPFLLATLQWFRDVDSHHDERAYETRWVLNLPGIFRGTSQGAVDFLMIQ
jgi:hypothetical protein